MSGVSSLRAVDPTVPALSRGATRRSHLPHQHPKTGLAPTENAISHAVSRFRRSYRPAPVADVANVSKARWPALNHRNRTNDSRHSLHGVEPLSLLMTNPVTIAGRLRDPKSLCSQRHSPRQPPVASAVDSRRDLEFQTHRGRSNSRRRVSHRALLLGTGVAGADPARPTAARRTGGGHPIRPLLTATARRTRSSRPSPFTTTGCRCHRRRSDG